MALLEWSDDFNTDIRAIDTDHKNLFDAINMLHEAHAAGKGEERILFTVEMLQKYVAEHFEREERFLEQAGYPDFVNHRAAHREFTQLVLSLGTLCHHDQARIDIDKVIGFLSTWLRSHILETDMKYIPYLRGEKQGSAVSDTKPDKGEDKVHLNFTVSKDKAEIIRVFVETITGGGASADRFEKAVQTALEKMEENQLAKARNLFLYSQ